MGSLHSASPSRVEVENPIIRGLKEVTGSDWTKRRSVEVENPIIRGLKVLILLLHGIGGHVEVENPIIRGLKVEGKGGHLLNPPC